MGGDSPDKRAVLWTVCPRSLLPCGQSYGPRGWSLYGWLFLSSRLVDSNRLGKLCGRIFLPRRLIVVDAERMPSGVILSSWVWGAHSVSCRLFLRRSRFGTDDLSNRQLLSSIVVRADSMSTRSFW